jgi:nicotinamidase-related amidase
MAEQAHLGDSPRAEAHRVAFVVIDFSVAFTDSSSALSCDADDALRATDELLQAARHSGAPVIFTTVGYDAAGKMAARAFLEKGPALSILDAGSRWVQIDERVAPRPGEPVITKLFASAFFQTALSSLLTAAGCDIVLLAGASTSGCVRATAVDAIQHGYKVFVAREAVADRNADSHRVALADVQSRYGDVVDQQTALGLLRGACRVPCIGH